MISKIIINGRSLAGKDVTADYLCDKYGFKKISFAEGIYKVAYDVFGMTIKDRDLLQKIGQKMREIKSTVWIDYVMKEINQHPNDKWAISDCRQANEYNIAVDQYEFTPIRVSADYELRVQRAIDRDGAYPDTSLWLNSSETGADDFNYIEINNNGTFEYLYQQIDVLMRKTHE